ncbi:MULTISPECIES: peptidoglycan editing factor PgeF [Ramlibacter]|uniref:Purine nucleoside phosphorylase n=1 Tax=Ramlibacter pinisoli TaxID=2682844 RepID=A0A6N8IQX6_9BURK|nr:MULTISPECIES: peptidoglycan editing factor PgeF [Ramlibacter]MBA2963286.1 peptidoglycan editing factor PgeF [Ramlibacter sp. CGMCC 1.13660]MVQ28253.1 peptidoglycan editing factor PgeF [Ramlibacter pinisoli]
MPAGVHAACSVREGGVSVDSYASLNLGDHVGDDAQAVAENRQRYARALGARPVFLKQVHGSDVARLAAHSVDGTVADACWTTERQMACTIMVADCLPVLLADTQGRCVAAAHAGWRGLAGTQGQGVLEALWRAYWPQVASSPEDAAARTLVWLGPCIGPSAFEVGDEVKTAFESTASDAARRFTASSPGKWLANLQGLARDRLRALGLRAVHGNDGTPAWCTVSNPSRFFSHRRDRVSGRFAAAVWLG